MFIQRERPGRQGNSDIRRVQVLEAAARTIGERGLDRVRLVDVARTAGVSIGLIQYYFKTREELLHATFEAFNDAFIEEWERAAGLEPDPLARVDLLLQLSSFEPRGWEGIAWPIWVEFWSICRRNPEFRPQYKTIYEKWRGPFREAIEQGIALGSFAPRASVEDIVDQLIAQIEGLRNAVTLEPGRMPRERMLKLLREFVEAELGATLGSESLAGSGKGERPPPRQGRARSSRSSAANA